MLLTPGFSFGKWQLLPNGMGERKAWLTRSDRGHNPFVCLLSLFVQGKVPLSLGLSNAPLKVKGINCTRCHSSMVLTFGHLVFSKVINWGFVVLMTQISRRLCLTCHLALKKEPAQQKPVCLPSQSELGERPTQAKQGHYSPGEAT